MLTLLLFGTSLDLMEEGLLLLLVGDGHAALLAPLQVGLVLLRALQGPPLVIALLLLHHMSSLLHHVSSLLHHMSLLHHSLWLNHSSHLNTVARVAVTLGVHHVLLVADAARHGERQQHNGEGVHDHDVCVEGLSVDWSMVPM